MADQKTNSPSASPPVTPEMDSPPRVRRFLRWYGAVLGLLAAALDTAALKFLGATFLMHGLDVTPLVGAWFGLSFSILGYLLGGAIEARRREAHAVRLIRNQMETIRVSRAKLAQSEKLAALGQLAASIAHEVRNPLAVIRSASQNIHDRLDPEAKDEDSEAVRSACSFINDETDRLSNLISALLEFARPVQLSPAKVSIQELFARAISLADEQNKKRPAQIKSDTDGIGGKIVEVDPELMSQVFLGLLSNAIQAAGLEGKVSIEARSDLTGIELAVCDSGPGVAPELRSRVFEPFFTTRSEGIGLGLATARQIVEAHGGRIVVSKSQLGGARFSVILPRARQLQ